jgi:hypothetical protein
MTEGGDVNMKLNHDCVRALLLTIEKEIPFNEMYNVSTLKESTLLTKYDENEILYTAYKLLENDFIKGIPLKGDDRVFDVVIFEITWSGHEFLENIRDNKIWSETKTVAGKISGVSLQILTEIAKNLISKHLGL